MMENGTKLRIKDMDEDSRFGTMEVYMKDIGRMTWQMDEVDLFIQMAMCTMDIGRMIRHMDMGITLTQTELTMKVTG